MQIYWIRIVNQVLKKNTKSRVKKIQPNQPFNQPNIYDFIKNQHNFSEKFLSNTQEI